MQHMELFSTPYNRLSRRQPSDRFSERKRALFPSQESDSDSDLGHMSPLELSSSPERYEHVIVAAEKDIERRYFNVFEDGNQPVRIVSRVVSSLIEQVDDGRTTKELANIHDKENVSFAQKTALLNEENDENRSPNKQANTNEKNLTKKWPALFQENNEKHSSPNKLQTNLAEVHGSSRRVITKKLSSLFADISQDGHSKSPVRLSQNSDILAPNTPSTSGSPRKDSDNTFIPETPVKSSPTQSLKTPHDNTNTNNLQLPRLVRKSLLDLSCIDKSNLKRKSDSPYENSCKHPKLDTSFNKVSKARTALFTENILSAKSFYPKASDSANKLNSSARSEANYAAMAKISPRVPAPVYLCSRQRRGKNTRKYLGQINAGVRHGIKKPKHKPALTKTQLLKAALNIVRNSPLNEILDKINDSPKEEITDKNECGVSLEQIQKMDSILKSIDTRTVQTQPFSVSNVYVPAQIAFSQTAPTEPTFGIKRSLSPQPDCSKKFFKTGPSRATVTINRNIKLNFDHGEYSLIEKRTRICKPKTEFLELDVPDFSLNEEDKTPDNSFSDILKSLEDDNICVPSAPGTISVSDGILNSELSPTNFTLTAHSSVTASENSIQLHTAPHTGIARKLITATLSSDVLLSPTSLVCDMTSGLALDSPKSLTVQNIDLNKLSETKKRISFPETMADESSDKKLFPIFYGNQNEPAKQSPKENRHVKNIRKIWKPLSEDQTLIDAGQKKFGVTQCPECKLVYSLGEPEDEIMHFQHHNSIKVLRYNGWKHERVVKQFHQGKVIQINPNDPKSWWRKVKEILENVVNRDLGFIDLPFDTSNTKVFLCIMNKQIVGCLVSEPKSKAYKMLPSTTGVDQCTEESYPVKCGISRLWVSMTHRKRGIATSLMNCMRTQFCYGHILSMTEVAFSSPTESGRIFASKYTKTESFLIYTS